MITQDAKVGSNLCLGFGNLRLITLAPEVSRLLEDSPGAQTGNFPHPRLLSFVGRESSVRAKSRELTTFQNAADAAVTVAVAAMLKSIVRACQVRDGRHAVWWTTCTPQIQVALNGGGAVQFTTCWT